MSSTDTATQPTAPAATDALPSWRTVLAVVAHPDDESFGLGAVLDAFARAGAEVRVLCLTHGEASTLHGVTGDLSTLRAAELQDAARQLGVAEAVLRDHPDGALAADGETAAAEVRAEIERVSPEGLVVFDPSGVTGHPDHSAATDAALRASEPLRLPVLGWTLPADIALALNEELDTAFVGHEAAAIDLRVAVDRDRQQLASLAHASQAIPTSVLWRRLELLGGVEHLRWLRAPEPAEPLQQMDVAWQGEDQFTIAIRGHELLVDQPLDIGADEGPTPTELFIASLASCVAFYARRYLRRHKLDATGLRVETGFRMAAKPARVGEITLRIHVPADLPENRRDGLLAMASHCTVHNSIVNPPRTEITLEAGDPGHS